MTEFTEDDKEMLKGHDETLRGNGDIGLKAEVKINTAYMKEIKGWVKWAVGIVAGSFILQVIDMAGK